MELPDFLLARIADDEAVANLARPDDHLDTRNHRFLVVEKARGYAHVAATSGRVLAECAAKRRIVERHQEELHERFDDEFPGTPYDSLCAECNGEDYPCPTLRLLALPYVDHPDYREEWRP